jgi:hypothetical protein
LKLHPPTPESIVTPPLAGIAFSRQKSRKKLGTNRPAGRFRQTCWGDSRMGVLLFRCPRTGKTFSTGIQVDGSAVQELPQVLTSSACPHCGSEHHWWTREATVAEAIPPSEWIENQKPPQP